MWLFYMFSRSFDLLTGVMYIDISHIIWLVVINVQIRVSDLVLTRARIQQGILLSPAARARHMPLSTVIVAVNARLLRLPAQE